MNKNNGMKYVEMETPNGENVTPGVIPISDSIDEESDKNFR